jgi:hypothetical protein
MGEARRRKKNPRFVYNSSVQRSANIFGYFLYGTNTIGATSLLLLHLFLQTSPINWAVLTGNRNMVKPR